jgi:pimeloyl-ACP methyl ester carboxylesterase
MTIVSHQAVTYPTRLPTRNLEVGKHRIRCVDVGAGRVPVVLLHGTASSLEMWAHTVPALAERHRVIALDMVGFGYSSRPDGPLSPGLLADVVRWTLEILEIGRAHLVGLSLGGAVALRLALDRPEMAATLTLVGSAGLGDGAHPLFRLLSVPVIGELLSRPSLAGTRYLVRQCFADPAHVDDALVDFSHSLACMPGSRRSLLSGIRSLGIFGRLHPDVKEAYGGRLHELRAPTLLIWGEEDRILPARHARQAHERIPGSELHILPGCGHLVQIECAGRFNALLSEFLERGEDRPAARRP